MTAVQVLSYLRRHVPCLTSGCVLSFRPPLQGGPFASSQFTRWVALRYFAFTDSMRLILEAARKLCEEEGRLVFTDAAEGPINGDDQVSCSI